MAKACRNSSLGQARAAAHEVFDKLWVKQHLQRSVAYRWLALRLGLAPRRAHISKFDEKMCKRAIELCEAFSIYDWAAQKAIREAKERKREAQKRKQRTVKKYRTKDKRRSAKGSGHAGSKGASANHVRRLGA